MAASLLPSAAAASTPAFSRGATYKSISSVGVPDFLGNTHSLFPRGSSSLKLVLPVFCHLRRVEKRGLPSLRCHCSSCSSYDHIPLQFGDECVKQKFCRRNLTTYILSSFMLFSGVLPKVAKAESLEGFREYVNTFEGYTFLYPGSWIQVRGAGADIFFRDPFILDENLSLEISSPSSSYYKSVEDLGPPEEAGKKVLRQCLTEFMSTRLGVRRESRVLLTSSRVADDGRIYYQVEANIKSYANNNELAVMPQDRITRLEWDRRYLSVLGVENNRLYELRLQTPEKVFLEEEKDLRQVMDSFRVLNMTK